MVIRRGVVVVHGVGSQNRADHLDLFTEPLVRFLGSAVGPENVELDVRPATETSNLAWATLHLKARPEGADESAPAEIVEEWHIREAWWARHFKPSASKTVLFWGFMAGISILGATWQHLALRNVQRVFGGQPGDAIRGRPWDYESNGPTPVERQGVWTIVGAGRLKAFLDFLVWLVWSAAFAIAGLVGFIALLVLYVFLLFPLSFVFPERVANIQRKLTDLLVSSIGDQHAITSRRIAVAGAANEVERALWMFLHPKSLTDARAANPAFAGYDTVTVVAHSAGCVVSYDAIVGRDVQEWLARLGTNPPQGIKPLSRLNWVTVGSGLNLAWRMRRKKNPQDAAFWRQLKGINWLNIYARYDPVPQGAPPREMIEALVGEDPLAPKRKNGDSEPVLPDQPVPRPPYVNLRVANEDWVITDHNRYWNNDAEVASRIAHVIADSRLGTQAINPDDVEWLPSGTGDPPAGLSEHIMSLASEPSMALHRKRVTIAAVRRLGVLALAVVAVVLFASDVGAWVFGSRPLWGMNPLVIGGFSLGDLVPEKIGDIGTYRVRNFLGGALVIAYVGIVVQTLYDLIFRGWRWWRGHGGVESRTGPPGRACSR
jgi:hypothetical protein